MMPAELTDRQWEIAQLIAQAATSKQIAHALGMTDGNVERHVCNIAKLLKLDSSRNLRIQIARVVWTHKRAA